jgi:DNA polymerase III delta subunit
MSYKALQSEIAGGLKRPVYLIYSSEEHLLIEAKLMVRSSIPPEAVDFAFEAMDGREDFSAERLVNSLKGVPFMGGRMTVVLENMGAVKAPEMKKLKAYAERPEPHSTLVLLLADKAPPAGFEKARHIRLALTERELPAWIREKAREEGMKLSEQVVQYLADNFATEPGLIPSEIKKIALIGKPFIEMGDIEGLMERMAGHKVFDLVKALASKDAEKTLRLCREFTTPMEANMLLGALNKEYGRMRLSPEDERRIFDLLADRDVKTRAQYGFYPIEELCLRLLKA